VKGDKQIIPEFGIFSKITLKLFCYFWNNVDKVNASVYLQISLYITQLISKKYNVLYMLTAPGSAVNTNWLSPRKSVIVSVYYVTKASAARVHARNSGTDCRRGSLGLGRGIWTTYPTCVYIVGWVRRLLGWLLASGEWRSGQTRGHWNQLYGPDFCSGSVEVMRTDGSVLLKVFCL
jgi:hypothetical protein